MSFKDTSIFTQGREMKMKQMNTVRNSIKMTSSITNGASIGGMNAALKFTEISDQSGNDNIPSYSPMISSKSKKTRKTEKPWKLRISMTDS